MAFKDGSTYRIKSKAFDGYTLNVYGTNATSTGRNVCLYPDTPSDIMQKWVLRLFDLNKGSVRLHSAVNNNYVLDRSDGSLATSCNNNAHLCKTTSTSKNDSKLLIEYLYGNLYRIKLVNKVSNKTLYLTAANSPGTSPASSVPAGTLTSARGNVYWDELLVDDSNETDKQEWYIEGEGASSGGSTGGDTSEDSETTYGSSINKNTAGFSSINPLTPWKDAGEDRYGMAHWNCTYYCWGRAYDVTGGTRLPMVKNAGLWYSDYTEDGTFTKRSASLGPVDNCIAVLNNSSSGGHVVFIEKVLSNNRVYYSEANMTNKEDGIVRLATITNSAYKMQQGNTVTTSPYYTATVLGYIVPKMR